MTGPQIWDSDHVIFVMNANLSHGCHQRIWNLKRIYVRFVCWIEQPTLGSQNKRKVSWLKN